MFGGVGGEVGGFRVRLGLNLDDYARGILQADAFNAAFGDSISRFVASPLAGSISLVRDLTGSFVRASREVLANAEAVDRLSRATGTSAELFQALRGRAEQAGFGLAIADQGLRVLNLRLGEASRGLPEAAAQFEALGISVSELGTTDQALSAVLDALAEIPEAGVRASFAAKLLGDEAGPRLVEAVGGGSAALAQMISEQRQLGQVIQGSTIQQLSGFNTLLGQSEQALRGVGTVLLAEFLGGFAGQISLANSDVQSLAATVIERLTPAVRDLGAFLGDIGDVIARVTVNVDNLAPLLNLIVDNINGVNAAAEFLTTGTFGGLGLGGSSAPNEQALRNRDRLERDRFLSDLAATRPAQPYIEATGARVDGITIRAIPVPGDFVPIERFAD